MERDAQFFPWLSLRRLFGLSADKSPSGTTPTRTVLFQLVECEVSTADALLDLNDLAGCDRHMSSATRYAEDLLGPENMVMHERLKDLRKKRTDSRRLR